MEESDKKLTYGLIFAFPSLLDIARQACERCPQTHGRADAVTAIVFSVVALEGFINELGAQAKDPFWDDHRIRCLGELMRELEENQASLQVKYLLGYFALTGEPCPKGAQPFQDFARVISLRNQLVHHKAHKYTYDLGSQRVIYESPKLVKFLADRRLIPEPSQHGDVHFMTRVGTREVAVWAYNTAVKTIRWMRGVIPPGRFQEMQLAFSYPDEIDPERAEKRPTGKRSAPAPGNSPKRNDGPAS